MSTTAQHRRTGRRAGALAVLAPGLLAASVVHASPGRAVNSAAGGLPADLVVSADPADGQDRPQLAVLDLDGDGARLADWHTDGYAARCDDKYDT